MQYISSDTSVWIDFSAINRIEIPFRLPYTYLMYIDAVDDELLDPPDIKPRLKDLGLKAIELTTEEFALANRFGTVYKRLSRYDRIALAIAKNKEITLMTGDRQLRKAAEKEGVEVIGTLGILDRLLERDCIASDEYVKCLEALLANSDGTIRLPEEEILRRIKQSKDKLQEDSLGKSI